MNKTMKAAVFEGIDRMVVRDVPISACEEDGMLVKVEACGICGGDIRNFHSGLRAGVEKQIIGHEIAGIVEQTGSKVTRFKVGDRVALAPDVSCGECYYCKRGLVNLCADHKMLGTHWPGGFAQYVYLPSQVLQRGFVEFIPEGMSFDDAAMAEPASSVIACQENINVSLGDTVVVFGDGPIGCIHIEVAKARGASKSILIGRRKLQLAKQFNPTHIINSNEEDPVKKVLDITDGLGADFCIIANRNITTQQQAIDMVRKRGVVVLFGGVSKSNPFTSLNSNTIHYNELTIVGSFSYPSTGLEKSLRYISGGKISASKYVTKQVTLDEVVDGIKSSEEGKALKVVIKPWS